MIESGKVMAVVSVVGKDQKGVVARVSTYLAEKSVNICDIEQRVMQGLFIMNMLVDLSDLDVDLNELMSGLSELGKTISMDIEVRLVGRQKQTRLIVMVTKEPHCLEQIIEDVQEERLKADVIGIWSNHETLRPMAEEAGFEFLHFNNPDRAARDAEIMAKLDEVRPDLIVLARYMQILPPDFVHRWENKIINIHPSLLPYHKGAHAYRQAWELGRRVAGCTAHFVTEDLDEGPIILQDVFHIDVGEDSLEDVKRKGQELESNVLSKAVQLFTNGELLVAEGKVVYKPGFDFFRKHHTL